MCKFGNKMCSKHWDIVGGVFLIFEFLVIRENGNFYFFLKSFPHFPVLSHTLSNSFRLCKFKKVGLKFVSQNVT